MPGFQRHLLLDSEPQPSASPKDDPPDENQLSLDPKIVPPAATSYSADEYNKLLSEKQTLTSQRDTLQSQLKNNELTQMKDKEQWKEIAELTTNENDKLTAKLDGMSKAIVQKEKMSAIRTAALQLGIRQDALDVLDRLEFPEVQIETTSLGNFNVVGAKAAVEAIKIKMSFLFGNKSGNLNGSLPEVVDGGNVTIDQIMKADQKARETGTAEAHAEYKKLAQKFSQQKQMR